MQGHGFISVYVAYEGEAFREVGKFLVGDALYRIRRFLHNLESSLNNDGDE